MAHGQCGSYQNSCNCIEVLIFTHGVAQKLIKARFNIRNTGFHILRPHSSLLICNQKLFGPSPKTHPMYIYSLNFWKVAFLLNAYPKGTLKISDKNSNFGDFSLVENLKYAVWVHNILQKLWCFKILFTFFQSDHFWLFSIGFPK